MSAMPDLLLQAAPEVKSKAKPQAKAPEPSKNEPSSFNRMYAKERQAQAGERSTATGKPVDERGKPPADNAATAADTAAESPVLAADGNSLPEEPVADELDPLLAMALGGIQPPVEEVVADEAASIPAMALPSVTVVEVQVPESDLEPEVLDSLSMSPLQEETEVKATVAQEAASKSARLSTSSDFAAAMAAMGKGEEKTASSEDKSALELPLDDKAGELLDSLKESTQPLRPDQFVSKLNALTQALGQQNAAQRIPLVPGQPVAMQQGGWSEAVVDRVMWLSSQNLKSAEIQLDPAELGRLEVRVNLSQEQAQVTFASPNASVRDALEGQMHRLRELFAQQGMNLADANVSDQSMNRGWQNQEQGDGSRRGGGGRDGLLAGDDASLTAPQEIRSERLSMGRGLVDYYA